MYGDGKMVDTTKASEGKYLNAEIVKNSISKKIVIIDEGEFVDGKYGEKFQITISIDNKEKIWSPNTDNVKALQDAYGKDSKLWISKICDLKLFKKNGKDAIIVLPMDEESI